MFTNKSKHLLIIFSLCLWCLFLLLNYEKRSAQLSALDGTSLHGHFVVLKSEYQDIKHFIPIKNVDSKHRFWLRTDIDGALLRYGDILFIKGTIKNPKKIRNPGAFDFRRYLLLKNISGLLYSDSYEKTGSKIKNPFKYIAFKLKARILSLHERALPHPYSDILIGLVFGDDGVTLSEDIQNNFRRTGLMHLLVVSGSQVSLLSGMVFLFLRKLGLKPGIQYLFLCLVNITFYFLTGGGASIFRAIVMNLLTAGTKTWHYKISPLIIILTALTIMLLIDPYILLDIGAQLSFLATLSLIYGVDIVKKCLPATWPNFLNMAISMSLAPFLFTTPLLWGVFKEVSLISLFTNLLLIDVIEILVVVGFFATLGGLFFYPILWLADAILKWVIIAMLNIVNYCASFSFSVMSVSIHWSFVVYLYTLLLFSFWCLEKERKALLKNGLYASASLLCLIFIFIQLKEKPLLITYLDVGQGDACVIETPKGKTIIIDSGGRKINYKTREIKSNEGTRTVLPYLNSKGLSFVDFLILTHNDMDHAGGAFSILEKKEIGSLVTNGRRSLYLDNLNNWQDHFSHKVSPLTDVTRLNIEEDMYLDFFHPNSSRITYSENESSIVCRLYYRGHSFLFTGDLEEDGELWLLRHYGSELNSTVLKLGHHGSKTSTNKGFLKQVNPSFVIVSAGQYNRFGHPAPVVVKRVSDLGVALYRTDRQGAIQIQTFGDELIVKTMLEDSF